MSLIALTDALKGANDWEYIGSNKKGAGLSRWMLVTGGAVFPPRKFMCECGHIIKENCYLRSKTLNEVKILGKCCMEEFLPDSEARKLNCAECGAKHRNRKNNLCTACNIRRIEAASKCVRCDKPRARGTVLCVQCADKCCKGSRINKNLKCRKCGKKFIVCDDCAGFHNILLECTHEVAIAGTRYQWTREDFGADFTLCSDGKRFLITLARTGKIGIKVMDGNRLYYYWTAKFGPVTDATFELITAAVVSGNYKKIYKYWEPPSTRPRL